MAAHPDPLEGSNFIVDIAAGDDASFSRVELPQAVVDEVAYRSGNDKSQRDPQAARARSYSHLVLTGASPPTSTCGTGGSRPATGTRRGP